MNLDNLSSYQNPEGKLRDRLAPRIKDRTKGFPWGVVKNRTVLDIGCNNGYFTREALRRGATRAVGVDISNAILGARELAKEEGSKAEFWQLDADSKEFQRHCPKFDCVFLFSVLTHLKDPIKFLDWLDSRVGSVLVFESNHGERYKKHIELIKEHFWFDEIQYLGATDIPEKPHYMWVCTRKDVEYRYPSIKDRKVKWMPMSRIKLIEESVELNEKNRYGIEDEKFKNLMKDIKERGIREPIILQPIKNNDKGEYRPYQGGHRLLAAKKLGYKEVPVKIVRELID